MNSSDVMATGLQHASRILSLAEQRGWASRLHVCAAIAALGFLAASAVHAATGDPKSLPPMPHDLEMDYALSALPPHLREGATVYVLDPVKGYVGARKGTNGFHCFVARTEYSRDDFP